MVTFPWLSKSSGSSVLWLLILVRILKVQIGWVSSTLHEATGIQHNFTEIRAKKCYFSTSSQTRESNILCGFSEGWQGISEGSVTPLQPSCSQHIPAFLVLWNTWDAHAFGTEPLGCNGQSRHTRGTWLQDCCFVRKPGKTRLHFQEETAALTSSCPCFMDPFLLIRILSQAPFCFSSSPSMFWLLFQFPGVMLIAVVNAGSHVPGGRYWPSCRHTAAVPQPDKPSCSAGSLWAWHWWFVSVWLCGVLFLL